MTRIVLAALAVVAVTACGKGTAEMAADSTRNLTLANADSSYRLEDAPGAGVTSRPPANPTPSAGRALTLSAGSSIDATTERAISSRADKAGAMFTASVANDTKDSRGRVVIPAGSTINLTITELQPANDKGQADGRITVSVTSVTVGNQTYPLSASITSMAHTLQGRGVGTTEVLKTGAGVVLGGAAGRIVGGDTKGTIIGAVVGGAAGAVIAAQTANRDVVVAAGTPLVITLADPVTITVQ